MINDHDDEDDSDLERLKMVEDSRKRLMMFDA
jgi:hypothetical protein